MPLAAAVQGRLPDAEEDGMKPPLSRLLLRSLLPLLAAAAPATAFAGTHWLCGLSQDLVRLICVADPDSMEPDTAPVVQRTVRGVKYPLDPRQQYSVDIWAAPDELERVERLAKATICHRDASCQVTFSAPSVAADMARHVPAPLRRMR